MPPMPNFYEPTLPTPSTPKFDPSHPRYLADSQIYEAFEKNEYTSSVFIDMSKTFDTVDHSILLRKL